jgi:uncharacterized membrane protein YsdA (DUF1294 family)
VGLDELPAPVWIAGAYVLMSAVSYTLYALDKGRAKRGEWRVPESTLHLSALFGGWPGAYLARRHLRHKTRKLGFSVALHAMALLHVAGWGWFLAR